MNCVFWSIGVVWLQGIGHLLWCPHSSHDCYRCPWTKLLPMCPDRTRTPSNPPLDPIPGQRHIVRRHRKHMVGYRRANGVEEWSVPPVLFQPRTNLPTFTLTGIIFRRNSGFSLWHWRGILDFHRGNCVESER